MVGRARKPLTRCVVNLWAHERGGGRLAGVVYLSGQKDF